MAETEVPNEKQASLHTSTTVGVIAAQLGETSTEARSGIAIILKLLGEEATLAYVKQAQEIAAGPGMLTDDGTRQRTLGGIFFKLARSEHQAVRVALFRQRQKQAKKQAAESTSGEQTPLAPTHLD